MHRNWFILLSIFLHPCFFSSSVFVFISSLCYLHLIFNVSSLDQKRQLTVKEQVVLRLESQYPDDVGIIAAFFFELCEAQMWWSTICWAKWTSWISTWRMYWMHGNFWQCSSCWPYPQTPRCSNTSFYAQI